jgi:CDP-diacylglycerol--glycerol-3-phosphate 3-phosphatidyltransferase|tara:strand:- start:490 stop:1092 length:603 start_codon:yes stop_codon:yes gene_type:complete
MISVYDIKPKFQKLLFPLLTVLRRLGITPNHITVFSILFSFLTGFLFLQATENKIFYLVVALGLLLRMGLNALDGMMANKYNLKSTKGEILNEIGDVISDIAIYFPLLYFENFKFEYVVLFIVLSVINEFCGVLAKSISGERRYDGPMGKSDRALFIGILSIYLFFSQEAHYFINYILILVIILMMLSSYLRLINAMKNE